MIDNHKCKETLQECATLAELLTAPQDLHEAHTRDLESQCGLSHKSIFGLGCTFNYTFSDKQGV
jgi:hypothetical protein